MTTEIKVGKVNEHFLHIEADPGTEMEIRDYFSFDTPNKEFMPLYKNRMWDGKTRLYNAMTHLLPSGLYMHLHKFCKERGYKINKVATSYGLPLDIHDIKLETVKEFINSLDIKLPDGAAIRDYQIDAIYRIIRYQRRTVKSPTASGKSLIIYCFLRYMQTITDKPLLLVVPTINLVNQMYSDFAEYSANNGWDVAEHCAKMYGTLPRNPEKQINISTWQGIYKQPREFFAKYHALIGDEVHEWKAKSMVSICQKSTETKWRIGTTGTLHKEELSNLTIEGSFGPVLVVATTKQLMDQGFLTPIKIKAIVLGYPKEMRKIVSGMKYQDELAWILANENRNKFIARLANKCEGTTLVLFQRIAKHGVPLLDMVQKYAVGRTVHMVHGGVDADDREAIRKIAIASKDDIVLASVGTFATGINIPNLRNILFTSPTKAQIKVPQAIGRGLRLSKGKEYCTLYDIADDLSNGVKFNTTLQHFLVRINIYETEEFEYSITNVPFSG
jgi:superfamily II DNA or RNA helicase